MGDIRDPLLLLSIRGVWMVDMRDPLLLLSIRGEDTTGEAD
jgi:hypothetical protein